MNGQGSLFSIIFQGGWLSILVLLVLLLMSVMSWAVIVRKWIFLSGLSRKAKAYLKSIDLSNGLADTILRSEKHPAAYPTRIFQAAHITFIEQAIRFRENPEQFDHQAFIQKLERSVEKSIITEKMIMEKELGLLATISSSAPFIGLLGTVTGIIDAFYSIAAQGASSIAVVAPGISAALVATAVGLFTAIPALIGYNSFREKARSLTNEMNGFGLEVIALLDHSIDDNSSDGDELFPEIKLGRRKN